MKNPLFIALFLAMACALAQAQEDPNSPHAEIDRSVNAAANVDVSVHAEVEGVAQQTPVPVVSGVPPAQFLPAAKAAPASAVWPHAVANATNPSGQAAFGKPSFQGSAPAPIATVRFGLGSGSLGNGNLGNGNLGNTGLGSTATATPQFPGAETIAGPANPPAKKSGPGDSLDFALHPLVSPAKLFGTFSTPARREVPSPDPSTGLFTLPSVAHEKLGLPGPFESNQPGNTGSAFSGKTFLTAPFLAAPSSTALRETSSLKRKPAKRNRTTGSAKTSSLKSAADAKQ
jgi:hypothetical protein